MKSDSKATVNSAEGDQWPSPEGRGGGGGEEDWAGAEAEPAGC